MALTREEVLNVAKLSRLEFGEEEIAKFQVDLNSILKYVDELSEVDTEGVEPM
ncbi:MAG: Asp-tRNA(Asn)/Glu-tRNA(Gln) amidotransferase subunit GatC, partial [Fusobacteriaceae bacterium]